MGVRSLEMLAITNYDEDHVSGLPNLLSRVVVNSYLRNPTVSGPQLLQLKSETGVGPGIRQLSQILPTLAPGPVPFRFPAGVLYQPFWCRYPDFDDENNLSMVLYLNVNGTSFLFPGDLEVPGWEALLRLEDFRQRVRETKVLVASHHGRESGLYKDLFDKFGCRPTLVVISDDYHQYDTQQTTNYYRSKCGGITNFRTPGCERHVLTTRRDGTITFTFGEYGTCLVS
jgi:beta-lactamase superfamily II metal-dependent hydrolase